MEQLRPKMWNLFDFLVSLHFVFIMFSQRFKQILCFPNYSIKYYHDTRADKLHAQQKLVLVSVTGEKFVSAHGDAMA